MSNIITVLYTESEYVLHVGIHILINN